MREITLHIKDNKIVICSNFWLESYVQTKDKPNGCWNCVWSGHCKYENKIAEIVDTNSVKPLKCPSCGAIFEEYHVDSNRFNQYMGECSESCGFTILLNQRENACKHITQIELDNNYQAVCKK